MKDDNKVLLYDCMGPERIQILLIMTVLIRQCTLKQSHVWFDSYHRMNTSEGAVIYGRVICGKIKINLSKMHF